jgi:hypothetical protein
MQERGRRLGQIPASQADGILGWNNRCRLNDEVLDGSQPTMIIDKPYDQFLLFGDSITQQAGCQDRGFAFAPALQDGNTLQSNATVEKSLSGSW